MRYWVQGRKKECQELGFKVLKSLGISEIIIKCVKKKTNLRQETDYFQTSDFQTIFPDNKNVLFQWKKKPFAD